MGYSIGFWRQWGLCREVEDRAVFFPEPVSGSKPVAAVRICNRCPVQPECFEFAYKELPPEETVGVWGGFLFPPEKRQRFFERAEQHYQNLKRLRKMYPLPESARERSSS
jgi:hypothetical protein